MGEFVEESLEGLLSVFEQIGELQLFTSKELNTFIKRCRQFEYRLNKKQKIPRDFNLYAEYLCDFLNLLKLRRTRVLKRRRFITEEKDKRGSEVEENYSERVYDGEVDDNIMNLNVARAVVEQGLSSVRTHDAAEIRLL
uniref:V-type proton ATPase subunit a n=1 Tax=Angiostrongylus cantonensis TaxID=6313 RepID=A0A0K0D518_ANGCA